MAQDAPHDLEIEAPAAKAATTPEEMRVALKEAVDSLNGNNGEEGVMYVPTDPQPVSTEETRKRSAESGLDAVNAKLNSVTEETPASGEERPPNLVENFGVNLNRTPAPKAETPHDVFARAGAAIERTGTKLANAPATIWLEGWHKWRSDRAAKAEGGIEKWKKEVDTQQKALIAKDEFIESATKATPNNVLSDTNKQKAISERRGIERKLEVAQNKQRKAEARLEHHNNKRAVIEHTLNAWADALIHKIDTDTRIESSKTKLAELVAQNSALTVELQKFDAEREKWQTGLTELRAKLANTPDATKRAEMQATLEKIGKRLIDLNKERSGYAERQIAVGKKMANANSYLAGWDTLRHEQLLVTQRSHRYAEAGRPTQLVRGTNPELQLGHAPATTPPEVIPEVTLVTGAPLPPIEAPAAPAATAPAIPAAPIAPAATTEAPKSPEARLEEHPLLRGMFAYLLFGYQGAPESWVPSRENVEGFTKVIRTPQRFNEAFPFIKSQDADRLKTLLYQTPAVPVVAPAPTAPISPAVAVNTPTEPPPEPTPPSTTPSAVSSAPNMDPKNDNKAISEELSNDRQIKRSFYGLLKRQSLLAGFHLNYIPTPQDVGKFKELFPTREEFDKVFAKGEAETLYEKTTLPQIKASLEKLLPEEREEKQHYEALKNILYGAEAGAAQRAAA